MDARTILLATLLATAAFAVVPTAAASDTCTMAGCLDTCNMRYCLAIIVPDEIQPVADQVCEEGVLCF